jgi:hypothetical protein
MSKQLKIVFASTMHICMVLVFLSCKAQKTCTNCGAVTFKTRYHNKITGEYVKSATERDVNMWYKDSFAVSESHHVFFYEDPYKKKTVEVLVDHYKFIDLRTREIYEYSSFSDTARLIKKCLPSDSNCIGQCWKFFNDKVIIQTKNLTTIPDTAIKGIVYKRVRSIDTIQTEKGILQSIVYGYLRCDKKNDIYNIDAKFSKQMGCPVVKMEYSYHPQLYQTTYYEMEFRPGELTEKELKIFEAWARNARKYKANN